MLEYSYLVAFNVTCMAGLMGLVPSSDKCYPKWMTCLVGSFQLPMTLEL